MVQTQYLPPKDNELKANDVASLFDNVTDSSGNRLSKSEKRARILVLMKELCSNPKKIFVNYQQENVFLL